MLTALRLATARTPPPASPLPHRLLGRSHIRLRRAVTTGAAGCPDAAADDDDMQKVNDTEKPPPQPAAEQPPKVGDTMSSFGEGYATRSDEEGFGGIYGGNTGEEEGEKIIRGNTPAEYGENQGSEVKEKEKGRHQPHHHPST
ncbi:PREDICTED: uncharacterized protein LOC109177832 [Ipomoea nil]|uniref:uncharacterized protein LOC109177832 n=1 Tax=Ipomoea nil TaxID=35883 RepID=UPI000901D0D1|nr:PREDICTED: uncharacterized protein LOC109177832 [Ipomoea nil]